MKKLKIDFSFKKKKKQDTFVFTSLVSHNRPAGGRGNNGIPSLVSITGLKLSGQLIITVSQMTA